VATRVRIWCATRPELNKGFDTLHDTQALFDAIQALDALPADPKPARGEVVEVAMWCSSNGRLEFSIAGSFEDSAASETGERLGITRLSLVKGAGA